MSCWTINVLITLSTAIGAALGDSICSKINGRIWLFEASQAAVLNDTSKGVNDPALKSNAVPKGQTQSSALVDKFDYKPRRHQAGDLLLIEQSSQP